MKKLMKRVMAGILAGVMMMSSAVSAGAEEVSKAETVMIDGYECYEKDGEHYTMLNGKEYHIVKPVKEEIVTDPVLLAQLNSLLEDNTVKMRSYPSSTWPNMRTYDLTNGSTYSERVKLSNGDYYSPCFNVSIPDGFSTGTIVFDFYDSIPDGKIYIITTVVHLYSAYTWSSKTYNIPVTKAQNYKILDTGSGASLVTKTAFNMKHATSYNGLFTYYYSQP